MVDISYINAQEYCHLLRRHGESFTDTDTESNVIKFYSSLTIDASQVGYCHPGVGTLGVQNVRWWLARK